MPRDGQRSGRDEPKPYEPLRYVARGTETKIRFVDVPQIPKRAPSAESMQTRADVGLSRPFLCAADVLAANLRRAWSPFGYECHADVDQYGRVRSNLTGFGVPDRRREG